MNSDRGHERMRWIGEPGESDNSEPLAASLAHRLRQRALAVASSPTYLKCRQRVLEFLYERHRFIEAA